MKYLNKYKLFEKLNYKINYESILDQLTTDYDYGEGEIINIIDFKEKIDRFVNKIQSMFDGDLIRVYRNQYVDDDWISKVINQEILSLGGFWSYRRESANSWDAPPGSHMKKEVIITSDIDVKYINWEDTIILYLIFNEEDIEAEISMFSGVVFTLIEIDEIKNNNIIESHVINKPGYII